VLAVVKLGELASRDATALSGGQQQRLALARALVMEPALLLLDEPLSNLDAKLREDMRFELKRLQRELGITCVYVTHDQTEALAMLNEVAVMRDGRVEQVGRPREIYESPKTRFVADFIGTSNFIDGVIESQRPGGYLVRTHHGLLDVPSDAHHAAGETVVVSARARTAGRAGSQCARSSGRSSTTWSRRARARSACAATRRSRSRRTRTSPSSSTRRPSPSSPPVSSRRRAFVALLPTYVSVFLFSAGASALSVVMPVYLSRDAKLGPAVIGAIVGAFAVASLAARLPAGLAYSVRRGSAFLLAGGACSALSFALTPFTTSEPALAGLSALNGVGWSVATTAQLALLVARRPAGVGTVEAM